MGSQLVCMPCDESCVLIILKKCQFFFLTSHFMSMCICYESLYNNFKAKYKIKIYKKYLKNSIKI